MFLSSYLRYLPDCKVAVFWNTKAVIFSVPCLLMYFLCPATCCTQTIPGHAHNDYEQDRPLYAALDNKFTSIEVDVHLVNGELYVAHDKPSELDPSNTLEALYLAPLKKWVDQHAGVVYQNSHTPFYLMIDFKTNGVPTFGRLQQLLSKYKEMLAVVENGQKQSGAIHVFISGNRPIELLLESETLLATLDGRPVDLTKEIPSTKMPVISQNFFTAVGWNGIGKMPRKANKKLRQLVRTAHRQGKKVRFWAAPDTPTMWSLLLKYKVDLINTDRIEEFAEFYQTY